MTTPETIRVDWSGGDGRPAVFLHANGFVPRVYAPFLQSLKRDLSIEALATRGQLGFPVPRSNFGWEDIGEDVGRWLRETKHEPVIGIGHSMGATSLIYAAARFPSAFRGLVLIEPASQPALMVALIRRLPFSILKKFHPVRGAIQKRDRWDSKEDFLNSCKRSGLYERFDATSMQAITENLVVSCENGLRLVYPKEWEAFNFARVCDPIPTLHKLKLPILGIRAADSFFMNDTMWRRFSSAPSMVWQTQLAQFGHLLPLEGPDPCAETVLGALEHLQ